jgi:GNAT superfamily N-acetyltransferase
MRKGSHRLPFFVPTDVALRRLRRKKPILRIVSRPSEVAPFLADVAKASDANSAALGFFAASIFHEHAAKELLLIAVSDSDQYCGHLLFDRRFPRASVLQVFAAPSARRSGVASMLIRHLTDQLTSLNYLSIRARVAEDLVEANEFWGRNGFVVARKVAGGATTGRTILVRILELDSPQLFPKSAVARNGQDTLGLSAPERNENSTFLVDLNVMFDLAHARAHTSNAVGLFLASHSGDVKLVLSEEMHRELARTASGKPDVMFAMIRAIPQVLLPPQRELSRLEPLLAALVFPEKAYPNGLSANDRSDVRHLATAHFRMHGFITRDGRVLAAAAQLERQFGIRVLSPSDFTIGVNLDSSRFEWEVGETPSLSMQATSPGEFQEVIEFLCESANLPQSTASSWLPRGPLDTTTSAQTIRSDGQIVGYVRTCRVNPGSEQRDVLAALDESSKLAKPVGQIILRQVLDAEGERGAKLLKMRALAGQSTLREVARAYGFREVDDSDPRIWVKLALPLVVTRENWGQTRAEILRLTSMGLPPIAPKWGDGRELVELQAPSGERRFVTLDRLESLMSPAIFAVPGRPAVLVPIRERYSRALLNIGPQRTMGPQSEALSLTERMYVSGGKTLPHYSRGSLIFFYESGAKGAQAVVCVARIVDTFLLREDEISDQALRRSVLRVTDLNKIGKSRDKAACVFESVLPLRRPVPLSGLVTMGISAARLVTANALTQQQIAELIRQGNANA